MIMRHMIMRKSKLAASMTVDLKANIFQIFKKLFGLRNQDDM